MINRLLLITLVFAYAVQSNSINAQVSIPSDINTWIDEQFTKGLDSLGIVGASIVLVHQDSIIHKEGYGVENIKSKTSINPDASIFTVASISKTYTATAIMQLYENGKIDLDTDVNNYLKNVTLKYPFGSVITVRNLLTHTAGFDERNLVTQVRSEDELVPLSEHLKSRMPPQIRRAGEVFDYSNYGFGLLGLIVEDVSGVPFYDYVREHITEPLGMKYSGFEYDEKAKEFLVTSYLQKDGEVKSYQDYLSLNYPAGGFHSTAGDMSSYMRMYLNRGTLNGNQLLQPETIEKMWSEIYQHLSQSSDGWGLGFDYREWRGKKIMGHGGDILGFATDLRLLPNENFGMYVSFNSSSIPGSASKRFLNNFWYELLKKIFPNAEYVSNDPPEIGVSELALSEYEGTYRFTRYAHTTLDKLAVFIGFAPEITIEKNEDSLRVKEWDYTFYPTSRSTFFAPGNNEYVAFGKEINDEVSYFYLSGTEGYHKLKFYDTVKFQMYLIVIILIFSLIAIFRSILRFFSKKKTNSILDKIQGVIAVLIFVFLGVVGYSLASTDPQEFLYGVPSILKYILYVPFVIIGLTLLSIFLQFKPRAISANIMHYVTTIVFGCFVWWLYNWNLLGFNF